MKATTAAVLSSFALGVGGVGAFLTLNPPASDSTVQAATNAPSVDTVALADAVNALRAEVADLKERSQLSQVAPRTSGHSVSPEDLAQAVAAYMEGQNEPEAAALDVASLGALGSAEDIAALLAASDDLSSVGLWDRIVKEGRDEEVLAYFKALADANPHDPEAQLALGKAYLGRTQQAGPSPLAGKFADLADKALDAALEADPEHWESRFTKATALSFWPPVFGKQASAIQEYETLVGQQQGQAPAPHHAQTHLLLGNMYHQTGQADKALAAWRAGLEIFPDHAELAKQIAILSGN